jgi:hypothetical protein
MGWLIALAVLCGLAVLPIGFRAVYRESQSGVWLLIGPFKLRVYPGKPKKKEPKAPSPKPKAKKAGATGIPDSKKGGNYKDFLPVIRMIIAFLEHFRRKLRVNDLELKLVLAGGDPCDLAVNYGKAWAALGNLMPQLERLVVIKKRNLEVECDFASDATVIYAKADVTITVARTLYLLSWHGVRILYHLLKLRKSRKGGAKL